MGTNWVLSIWVNIVTVDIYYFVGKCGWYSVEFIVVDTSVGG